MSKHIELNQIQDPDLWGRTISDVHVDGDRITVEFLSEEGSDPILLEDLTKNQLKALIKALIETI